MAKVYVEFDIADQTLCTHIPTSTIRAGTQGTYFAKFSFDAAWADLANIRAVFFRDKLCKAMDLVKEDDSFVCEIHPAVIAEPGQFSLGLFAGKQQITNLEFVPVLPSFKNELFQNADVLDWFTTVDQYIADILKAAQWKENMTDVIDEKSTAEQYPNAPAVVAYTQTQDLVLKTVIEGLLQTLDEKLTVDIGTKSPIGHHHDNRYFTEDEIINILLNYTTTDISTDLQNQIRTLTTHLNAILDSDDTTLDQLSEIVAYIKSNKELIEAITTSKANAVHDHDDRYFTQEAIAQFVNTLARNPITITETLNGTSSTFVSDYSYAQIVAFEGLPYVRYMLDVGAGANLVCEAPLYVKDETKFVFASAPDAAGVSYHFVIDGIGVSVSAFSAKEYFAPVPFITEDTDNAAIPNVFAVRNYVAEKQPLVLNGSINGTASKVTLDTSITAETVSAAYTAGRDVVLEVNFEDEGMTDICLWVPLRSVNSSTYFFSTVAAIDSSGDLYAINVPIGRSSLAHYGILIKKITTENF